MLKIRDTGFLNIAEIEQKPIETATTTSCGWLNPRNSVKSIDYVTSSKL